MTGVTPVMPAGSVDIRPASERNLEGIHDLAMQVLPATYVQTGLLPAAEVQNILDNFWSADYFSSIIEKGAILWVAENSGAVVGVAEIGRFGQSDAIMWKLYVDTALQGQRLGTRLLAAARADLWPGTERWFTEYVTGNEPAAAFYAMHGFEFDHEEQDKRPSVDATYTWCVRDAQTPICLP